MSCRRCIAALLASALIDHVVALDAGRAVRKTANGAASVVIGAQGLDNGAVEHSVESSKDIPAWKVELMADDGKGWWGKFGRFGAAVGEGFRQALWGNGLPQISSTPAQDQQRCPVIKLPEDFNLVANRRSWTSLHGEWSTNDGVKLATWEQNFIGMAFSRDVRHLGVSYRTASTGKLAFMTRIFTDQEMRTLYGWTAAPFIKGNITMEDPNMNLAIIDCTGALMYVLKKETEYEVNDLALYSRDGSLVAKARPESPILRFQWIDPKTKFLMATAEAPGYHANISEQDIPTSEESHVMPFGFHYETGGYVNASTFMESEFRWVLATAIQALYVSKAEHDYYPWTAVTLMEIGLITGVVLAVFAVIGLAYWIFRVVYPPEYVLDKEHYGMIADNPFLAVPECPPHRDAGKATAQSNESRQYAQNLGLHGKGMRTYSRANAV